MIHASTFAAFRFTLSSRLPIPAPAVFALVAALALPALRAQPMTMTDILGRSITAEPVSLEGDRLTIRRDDGRVFDTSLSNLTDADQARIREWQKNAPSPPAAPTPPPAAQSSNRDATSNSSNDSSNKPAPRTALDPQKIEVSTSRFKAGTRTLAKWEGYNHSHESWGYGIQIMNRNLYAAENIRVEYNLFARPMPELTNPVVVTGIFDLPSIGSSRSESVRTRTAEVCKRKGSWVYNSGGELRGIWVKVYHDGKVIQEVVTPDSLRNEERWTDPSRAPQTTRSSTIDSGYLY
jgi:hypothetical protein